MAELLISLISWSAGAKGWVSPLPNSLIMGIRISQEMIPPENM